GNRRRQGVEERRVSALATWFFVVAVTTTRYTPGVRTEDGSGSSRVVTPARSEPSGREASGPPCSVRKRSVTAAAAERSSFMLRWPFGPQETTRSPVTLICVSLIRRGAPTLGLA